jgi:hypothetical protein
METGSLRDIGVEIRLAERGRDQACETHAETACQYHPKSYRMQHEMHDSSEHRAKDDRGPAFCKYPYAVIAPAAQSDPAVVPKNLNRLTGAGYLEAVQRDLMRFLTPQAP